MPTNAKKIRIGGVSHDIEDTAARTSIGTLSSLKTTEKTNLVSAVNEVFDSVDGLGETYAKQDGYYQNMTVGDAEQLVSSMVVDDSVPYKFRTSGGSADIGNRAYMDKIVGGTVAWNQLLTPESILSTHTKMGLTFTRVNGKSAVEVNGTIDVSGQDKNAYLKDPTVQIKIIENHVYFSAYNSKYANVYCYGVSFSGHQLNHAPYGGNVIKATQSGDLNFSLHYGEVTTSGITIDETVYINLFDLTQMFGSTVADYIYSLEQSTAGAGVAFFRSLFPDPYYAYNAGEIFSVSGLQSHDTVGFNAWDEEWEVGGIDPSTGEPSTFSTRIRSKNYIPLISGATYYFNIVDKSINNTGLVTCYYDKDKNYIDGAWRTNVYNPFTVPNGARYMKFCAGDVYGNTYNNDISINLSHSGARNGEYEPYKKHSYPLDSSLTLRGVPKLDSSNKLYWDGDEYEPDGTVTRRYGVVDLGTLSWNYGTLFSNGSLIGLAKQTASHNVIANIICGKYQTFARNSIADKGIAMQNDGSIVVQDSAYTSAAAFKTAMSGVYLVYELATPTTETADAYQQIQNVDDYGTEEFVSTSIVPVGHVTRYPANLRDKLQHLPDLAASNGTYVILQSGSQMTLAPLTTPTELPAAPSTDGTYTLKATVSNGAVTYSWGA